jgi:nucleoside 2-deoxyribosyltransferase
MRNQLPKSARLQNEAARCGVGLTRRIYLAAAYCRRPEILAAAHTLLLVSPGPVLITSRWVLGTDPLLDTPAEEDKPAIAEQNLEDLRDCDLALVFTGEYHSRGGHHLECGYALGMGKQVVIIGPRQSVFHFRLPQFVSLSGLLAASAVEQPSWGYR